MRLASIGWALGCAVCLACGDGGQHPIDGAMQPAGANAPAAGASGTAAGGAGAGGSTVPAAVVSGSGGQSAGMGGAAGGAQAGTSGSAGMAGGQAGDAAAGSGGQTAGSGGASAAMPVLPPVTSTDAAGPFETMQDLRSGPRGASGVFRPATLGENGLRHPIFVWGCGGGSNPMSYADQLQRIASHGFVVIAEVSAIGDDGAPLIAALEWLVAENAREGGVFHQKLDVAKAAVGGHSIGSVNSFLVAKDPRWVTTIHVAGGSLDNVNDPFAPTTGMGGRSLVHPAAYICAESDVFDNTTKTEKDYANTTAPVFFTVIDGADHVGAARQGLPVTIAWLRWHLGGETDRRSDFLDPQGTFRTGKFVSQSKNW